MKLTQYLDKPVLGLYEAEEGGRISGAVFDKRLKRLKHLLVTLPDRQTAKLLLSAVAAVGPDAILIRNLSALTPCEDISNCPVHAALFDTEGRALGRVEEAELDERRNTLFLSAAGKRYLPEQILSGGPDAVLVCLSGPIRRPSPPRAGRLRESGKARPSSASALSSSSSGLQGDPAPEPAHSQAFPPADASLGELSPKAGPALPNDFAQNSEKLLSKEGDLHSTMQENSAHLPQREDSGSADPVLRAEDWGGLVVVRPPYTIYADFSYLVGRKAKVRVLDLSGEVLQEAGERVTPSSLSACKKHGRLIQLAKSCALHTLGPEV